MKSYRDKWAKLDPGIRQIVRILDANGVETCQSCAATGPVGGDEKNRKRAHSYPEPTVEFYGSASAGWHALRVALDHGLPVAELRRTWDIRESVPHGPLWVMTFNLSQRNLVGWLEPGAKPYAKMLFQ